MDYLLTVSGIIVLFSPVLIVCEECTGTLNGQSVTESCSVGGCCVPSDGEGDSLCCIPKLTIILVSVFIGGTILTIITVLGCCAICKYRNKRKNQQRLEERRRRQRERDQERQRRLMLDPFVNGNPFQISGDSVPLAANPPRYHGHAADTPISNQPPGFVSSQSSSDHRVPPAYPNSPPPAYYSRMGSRPETRVGSRMSTTTLNTRLNTRINTRETTSDSLLNDRISELSRTNTVTSAPGSVSAVVILNSNTVSRQSSRVRGTTNNLDSHERQRNNREGTLTIEDLENTEKDDQLSDLTEVKTVSRTSTKNFENLPRTESRISTKVMESILENEAPTPPHTITRATFIKSMSNVTEQSTGHIARPFETNELAVRNLDYV